MSIEVIQRLLPKENLDYRVTKIPWRVQKLSLLFRLFSIHAHNSFCKTHNEANNSMRANVPYTFMKIIPAITIRNAQRMNGAVGAWVKV